MYSPSLVLFSFLATLLCLAQAASIHWNSTDVVVPGEKSLAKRVDNAKLTWFSVGLGACGHNNVDSDLVLALSVADFGAGYPGPNCGRQVRITANGKTATGTVVDKCPGCPAGALDLSLGLFKIFADPAVEVTYGSWTYV
ncbi:hypothetical protein GLOTRDRAFT_130892 [Gloeophyllum trabeum ATCC 11539]|uniref:RlpA-like protein double-psi beta-barrel domain-containing protein n=1 Tax=Gloeophyllum trabeum (strain ATCC 11539 / FP-39264 / Madison 617) TaxID=670483 RepID=S7Q1Y4_GLOTA|nr:uncharacterized protein GLOTRDRAFT_130892 [Gloeophyllum trabeum ATCC 11539]EPQ53548.1 hypothetical protein GLOTRDRAFT_130892 [Gloeophyllum trabeum ATCC 11539]